MSKQCPFAQGYDKPVAPERPGSIYPSATHTLQQKALPSSMTGCNFMRVLSHRARHTKVCLPLPASPGNPTPHRLPASYRKHLVGSRQEQGQLVEEVARLAEGYHDGKLYL